MNVDHRHAPACDEPKCVLHARPGAQPRVDPQARRRSSRRSSASGTARRCATRAVRRLRRGVRRRGAARLRLRAPMAGRPPEARSRSAPATSPREVEARVFERWEEAGIFQPRAGGRRGGELLDRGAAAERHRRAAHGPRAQRRRSRTCCIRLAPDARQAHEVDLRHRPRRHRDPGPGREAARERGHEPRGARARGVHRARLAVARAVRRHDHRAVQAARRLARLRRRALHDGRRRTSRAVLARVRARSTRRASIYRDNYMVNWDPGMRSAISDLEVEQRDGRGHALHDRLPARVAARGRSRSRRCGRRRCWPTPRSP